MTMRALGGKKMQTVDGQGLTGVLAIYVEQATNGLRLLKQKKLNNYISTTGNELTLMEDSLA
jgi:hypothetical protein